MPADTVLTRGQVRSNNDTRAVLFCRSGKEGSKGVDF